MTCSYIRDDGFGARRLAEDGAAGRVEILDLVPALATPEAEEAIRARCARLAAIASPRLARVHRVERRGDALSVVSAAVDGVPLCELLSALEFGTLVLGGDALLELAGAAVRAVGTLHEELGSLAHGALNPAHLVIGRDGAVVMTDAIFADALQRLELSREELWRTFSLAMPAAATAPRFDRSGDVTQLGSIVLAVLLRRTLLAHEYPRPVPDLILAAAEGAAVSPAGVSRLRTWLQQALQIQARTVFPSGIEAAHAFGDVLDHARAGRDRSAALQGALRPLFGAPDAPAAAARPAGLATPPPAALPGSGVPLAPARPPRPRSLLRSVLPHLLGN